MDTPLLVQDLRLLQTVEDFTVEQLVAEPGVEAFAIAIIPNDIWMTADVWLFGHLSRKNIPIWLLTRQDVCVPARNANVAPLHDAVLAGAERDASNIYAIKYVHTTKGV